MTEQEYKAIIAEQSLEISKAREAEVEARRKISTAREEFCESLAQRYVDYIGRKVEIVLSIPGFNREEQEAKTIIGYLSGFKYMEYSNAISPVLAKIKKDGTASRIYYSEYDVASYEYISKIKILE